VSNIGNKIIIFPKEVKVSIKISTVSVTGPKGSLCLKFHNVNITIKDLSIIVSPISTAAKYKKYHGLYRTLINNMIIGVVKGFVKILHLNGLGYRANIENNTIALSIGFSHTVYKKIPEGLSVNIVDQNKTIEISGINKELVGLFASQIRHVRPPEPYLGKGIKYSDEKINKKQGKTNIK
jgi:large subunit ribosomal protein L6